MKSRLALLSPVALVVVLFAGTQSSACNGAVDDGPSDAGPDGSDGATVIGDELDEVPPLPLPDASVSCSVNPGEDFIDFCLQKQIIFTEHKLFNSTSGMPTSWSASTGLAQTDGSALVHTVQDDVAYGSSLGLYAISAQEYGDTSLQSSVLAPDLAALASLVTSELATLPPSYDGEFYLRLRRFAQGLRVETGFVTQNDATAGGSAIDELADAYGRAIYTNYFHPLAPATVDAGAADGGAGEDASADASSLDAAADAAGPADAAFDANAPEQTFPDGILGVVQPGGGVLYDVDQAASGALALVDMASRHLSDDPTNAYRWASAAASVYNHLSTRALHPSGLYYADLITSDDPGHDALASTVTPNDALLAETQASVAASLLRAQGLVQNANLVAPDTFLQLSQYPFAAPAVAVLSALKGAGADGGTGVSLWDPTPASSTTASCALLEDAAACGGSGIFLRYLPSTSAVDASLKTVRANALAFGAVHRSLVLPGSALSIDYEVFTALFQSEGQNGLNQSFLSQVADQSAYPTATTGTLALDPANPTFSAQGDAYAIEALTEQWIGRKDCPSAFF